MTVLHTRRTHMSICTVHIYVKNTDDHSNARCIYDEAKYPVVIFLAGDIFARQISLQQNNCAAKFSTARSREKANKTMSNAIDKISTSISHKYERIVTFVL